MNSLTYNQLKIVGILLIITIIPQIAYDISGIALPFVAQISVFISLYYLFFIQIFKQQLFFNKIYIIYLIYLTYLTFQVIYGIFNANNYWQNKDLLMNTISLLLPMIALFFDKPTVSISVLNTWKEILDPKYFFIFIFLLIPGYMHFLLGPVYFLFGVFIFWLPRKWQYINGCILIAMITMSLDARSQVITALLTIVMAFGVYFRKYINIYYLQFSHWVLYIISFSLLILGLTGVYNVFSPDITEGEMMLEANQVYNQENVDEDVTDLTIDTRTFIYIEVISSAIEHNYVIFGRSPARGNDTDHFAGVAAELDDRFLERSGNELCHLNVFTWMGIVGVVIYSLFYFQASILALYRSRNVYVKYFAVLVAFHWAFGWVEDRNVFDMLNVALWLIIGICLSPSFRSMNNKEFELWFKSIFIDERVSPYHRYELEKELSIYKKIASE